MFLEREAKDTCKGQAKIQSPLNWKPGSTPLTQSECLAGLLDGASSLYSETQGTFSSATLDSLPRGQLNQFESEL